MNAVISSKYMDDQIIYRLIWPVIISIIAAFVGVIIAIIRWGINSYLKTLSATIHDYQKEVKDSITSVNRELKTLQNQIANLTTSNQEVSFRVSSLNDKADTQYLTTQKEISALCDENKDINKLLSKLDKDVALLKVK